MTKYLYHQIDTVLYIQTSNSNEFFLTLYSNEILEGEGAFTRGPYITFMFEERNRFRKVKWMAQSLLANCSKA